MYDDNNIFSKIIKGEIPCKKVCENDFALCFYDINPKAKIHILIIPKGKYIDILDFSNNASLEEKAGFFDLLSEVIKILDIKNGFRTIANTGENSEQEVPHFHCHILAGEKLKAF